MTLRILAVGMLDPASGADQFFVQTGEDEVMLYEARQGGGVTAVVDEPAPLRFVAASIEKFNHMYRCEEPVPLAQLADLPQFLGRFEILTKTRCRLRA
jgi:hypothetical protein